MSLPETGRFGVAVEGHVLVFDGKNWTGPDNRWFNEYASLLLEMTTPQHLGTHITCPEAGRKILAAAFIEFGDRISISGDAFSIVEDGFSIVEDAFGGFGKCFEGI